VRGKIKQKQNNKTNEKEKQEIKKEKEKKTQRKKSKEQPSVVVAVVGASTPGARKWAPKQGSIKNNEIEPAAATI